MSADTPAVAARAGAADRHRAADRGGAAASCVCHRCTAACRSVV